ncbi:MULTISPECIES: NAD(P)/FAD-dependent oxidoreductase [unclassified Devosia]|uniref:NAD(P)/FAD-dependent oxidoreductase n=1 Tax=unclassified Devosia TaxID=196773 RepID=UPI0015574E7E|nr:MULTISPECIES: NAD(P)/FAD-dependent oxidoreductase [unclassified Devosia]
MIHYDVVVLGAGAAGMMAAIEAGKRGRTVLVVDHAKYAGEKIRISGGGRCNFTNIHATTDKGRDRFLSNNPRFALSALSRYTPEMFIAMVQRYGITYHEKTLGQLFCDGPATQINSMLLSEMRQAGVTLVLETAIEAVSKEDTGFALQLSTSSVTCDSLIVATGGKSIPKMGATGFGYQLAAQFGLRVTDTRPALVPLTFETGALERLKELAGIATDAVVRHGKIRFAEALLFTHRGLSGPAILQISSYWREGDPIGVDLMPGRNPGQLLRQARQTTPKLQIQTVLGNFLPKKLAQLLGDELNLPGIVGDFSDKKLDQAAAILSDWTLKPVGTEGYRTAEVTLGGIDTRDLDAKTMAARDVPGLYFVGEVVDVTGWLGGYNFQWAWASGRAAGQVA